MTVPYIKTPDFDDHYQVGDAVEAFCDHEKGSERIKGWLKGIVVQVDSKMVAYNFVQCVPY